MINLNGEDIMLIDSHVHIWNEFKGERFGNTKLHNLGYGKIKRGDDILDLVPPSFTDNVASAEILLGYMANAQIDKAVVLQNPCYGDQKEYVKDVMNQYPDKFLATIGMLDPRKTELISERIDMLVKDFSCKGVKLEVPDVPFVMDEMQYDFMWKKILNENLILVIDLGWGDGQYDFNIDQLTNVMKKFPAMRTRIAHLGVSRLWDLQQKNPYPELQKVLRLFDINKDNLYMDLSAMPFFDITEEHPDLRCQDILKTVYTAIGADKLMFGTDFPSILKLRTINQCLDFIINHCSFFSPDEKKKVLGLNALKAYT